MFLNFLASLYRVLLLSRERLFQIGVLKRKRLGCSAVSVGNITLGGTGKTPCVEMLAKLIVSKGKSVSIISRGYKRKSKGLKVVTNGKGIIETAKDSGDEAYYLAKVLKNIPVIVCKNRYKAGIFAVSEFSSSVVILDDGFQRRYSLYRDLDIVLIDTTNPFGDYKLFPAGILREPINKLSCADVFILTKTDEAKNKEELKKEIRLINRDALIIESIYRPVCFIMQDKTVGLDFIGNKKVFLLSSIANPFYFERIISKLNCNIIGHLKYQDHYEYSYSDITKIEKKFNDSEADYLITTEKDTVRLNSVQIPKELPIYSLKIEFEISNSDKLVELLKLRRII